MIEIIMPEHSQILVEARCRCSGGCRRVPVQKEVHHIHQWRWNGLAAAWDGRYQGGHEGNYNVSARRCGVQVGRSSCVCSRIVWALVACIYRHCKCIIMKIFSFLPIAFSPITFIWLPLSIVGQCNPKLAHKSWICHGVLRWKYLYKS